MILMMAALQVQLQVFSKVWMVMKVCWRVIQTLSFSKTKVLKLAIVR